MRSTFQGLARILRQLCDEGPEQVLFSRQVLGPGEGEGGRVALNFETGEMWIKHQPAHLPRCYLNIQIRSPKLSACASDFCHHAHTGGVVFCAQKPCRQQSAIYNSDKISGGTQFKK